MQGRRAAVPDRVRAGRLQKARGARGAPRRTRLPLGVSRSEDVAILA